MYLAALNNNFYTRYNAYLVEPRIFRLCKNKNTIFREENNFNDGAEGFSRRTVRAA